MHKLHIIYCHYMFIIHIQLNNSLKNVYIANKALDKLYLKLYYNYQRICIVFEVTTIEKI